MKAIIQIDIPEHQIGQEVSIYFKDTMMIKGVVQEPKTGHWIPIRKSTGTIVAVKCECCGSSPRHGQKTDYCPNCGARMKSEVRNETDN